MITRLPIGQIIVITITSILLSLILNVIRPDGIPLLAKELAVAEEIEYDSAIEPRILAITLDQALDLYQKGTIFVDAREPEYYQEGHIRGALNFPFFLELAFKLDSLQGKNAPLVSIAAEMNADRVRTWLMNYKMKGLVIYLFSRAAGLLGNPVDIHLSHD